MHAKRIRRGGVPMSQLVKKAQRGDKNAFITLAIFYHASIIPQKAGFSLQASSNGNGI